MQLMASHPAVQGPGGTRPLSPVPAPGTPFRAGAPFEQQKPPGVVGGETLAPTAFLLPGGRSLPAPGARSLSLYGNGCCWDGNTSTQVPKANPLKPHSFGQAMPGGAHPGVQPASLYHPGTAGTFWGAGYTSRTGQRPTCLPCKCYPALDLSCKSELLPCRLITEGKLWLWVTEQR